MSWLYWSMATQDRVDAGEEISAIEASLLETCQRVSANVLNEVTTMKFRQHHGSLADSMATLFEFNIRTELVAHVGEILTAWAGGADQWKIVIHPYDEKPDIRIGWDKTHIVYADGPGDLHLVIGFTDGPLERGPDDDWRPIASAPKDQTIIEGRMPDGSIMRMVWAWGGGWAGEWDRRRRHGIGGWLSFNDDSQPLRWRDCGAEKL